MKSVYKKIIMGVVLIGVLCSISLCGIQMNKINMLEDEVQYIEKRIGYMSQYVKERTDYVDMEERIYEQEEENSTEEAAGINAATTVDNTSSGVEAERVEQEIGNAKENIARLNDGLI